MTRIRSLPAALALSCSALLTASSPAGAADWPQWRGPDGDGSSPEKGLPTKWSPTENVAWKLPLPARSGSTPVVADGRIYLSVGYEPDENDDLELWAVDAAGGEVLWKRELGGGNEMRRKHHMSSPSPVTDGETVWAMTGTGLLYAFGADGERRWRRDLQESYGAFGLLWGYASSPLLHGDSLYVQVLHGFHTDDPSYLLRIDKATGETRWRIERPTPAVRESPDAYTTPAMTTVAGAEVLIVSGGDVVTGHDPATGRELWREPGINPDANPMGRVVASPLVVGSTVLAFGKRGPVVALRLGATDEKPTASPAWTMEKGTDVPTPTTDGKIVYLIDDRGIAWALDAAGGKVLYGPERLPAGGNYSASPVLADGKVYTTSEEGVTTVLRAGPEFEVLAENDLGGYVLSSPAVAGGRIYLRTDEFLWAVGEPESAAWLEVSPEAVAALDDRLVYHQGPDEPPVVVHQAPVHLPASHGALTSQNTPLIVELVVTSEGHVARARVLKGGTDPELEQALITSLRTWEWEPARLDGEPVAVHYPVTIRPTAEDD